MEKSLDSYVYPLEDNLLAKLHELPFSSYPVLASSWWASISLRVKRRYFPQLYSVPSKIEFINRVASVKYANNITIDCVLFEKYKWLPELSYNMNFQVLKTAEDFEGLTNVCSWRSIIEANKIIDIGPCPYQLPPKWCNKIYEAGESFMGGGHYFSIIFKDGREEVYLTGDCVDFIKMPDGYSYEDIVDVNPFADKPKLYAPEFRYLPFVICFYK